MFYTELLNAVKKSTKAIDGAEELDPVIANQETFLDPEDLIYDILQSMGTQTKDHAEGEQINLQQVLNEPMDLDEMICRSICAIENPELRKSLANNIILAGGPAKSQKFIETLEQSVMTKMLGFDDTIERVEVILCNV